MIHSLRVIVIFYFAFLAFTPATVFADNFSIGSFNLVGEKRVSRTEFEYTYTCEVINGGTDATDVRATVTSNTPYTTVVDGSLSFGTVAAGESVPSQDTFTVLHNRLYTFSWESLVWTISGEEQPGGITAVIQDVDTQDVVYDEEISIDANGQSIVRTKIEIAFMPDATEADMRGLLIDIGGYVTSSLKGTSSIVVRIPDPATLAALDDLIARIEAEPFVWFVAKDTLIQPNVLPDDYSDKPPNYSEWSFLDHHLAVRAHAAWNAKEAIKNVPKVIMVDAFGSGPPASNAFNCTAIPLGFYDQAWNYHGYHVLGIISARHDDMLKSTGIFPGTIQLDVIDLQSPFGKKNNDILTLNNTLISSLQASSGKIIVNTSCGYNCGNFNGHCMDLEIERQNAVLWIEKVRELNLEQRVIHLTSANNRIDVPSGGPGLDIMDAETGSPWNAARLLPGLTDAAGNTVPNLNNTLVVENSMNSPAGEYIPVEPQCQVWDSFRGGDISGVGTNVWSMELPSLYEREDTGTSMATAQVAGLAAFLWSIDSELTPQDIIAILARTARPTPKNSTVLDCSDGNNPAPTIDAYAAVLALDRNINEAGCEPDDLPVRLAILDVADVNGDTVGDGRFDEKDIEKILDEFANRNGGLDYSRYDLNGDGFTGGDNATYFNLDADPFIFYDIVTQKIETDNVEFNEKEVSDIECLCYYAYSPLFSEDGDEEKRRQLLAAHCKPITLMIAPSPSLPLSLSTVGVNDFFPDVLDVNPTMSYASFDFDPCARGGLPLEDEEGFPSGVTDYGCSANSNLTITHSASSVKLTFSSYAQANPVQNSFNNWHQGHAGSMVGPDGMNGVLNIVNTSDEAVRLVISWRIDNFRTTCPERDEYRYLCSSYCEAGLRIYEYSPCKETGSGVDLGNTITVFYFAESNFASGWNSYAENIGPEIHSGSYNIDISPGRHQFAIGNGEGIAGCHSGFQDDQIVFPVTSSLEGEIEFRLEPM